MSIRGTPGKCPKPCPSVSFDLNPVESSDSSQLYVNETITHNKQIQPVELENISEVESNERLIALSISLANNAYLLINCTSASDSIQTKNG